MSNKLNHHRDDTALNRKRTEHGPRYESANPGAGCNATHVAKGRKKYLRRLTKAERASAKKELGNVRV